MKRWSLLVLAALSAVSSASAQGTLPDWARLQADYAYVKAPVSVTEKVLASADGLERVHLSFVGKDGSTVSGLFVRPKADGVYPVVLLLHGLGGNKEGLIGLASPIVVQSGVAVLALDAPFHGERKTKQSDTALMQMFFGSQSAKAKGDLMSQVQEIDKDHAFAKLYAHMVHEGVLDYRLALDYLEGRKDVDRKHVGLLGFSFGSIMGSILAGVDSRVSFEMLAVGGDPALPFVDAQPSGIREEFLDACPSLFIGHAAGHPILMLNGSKDTVINRAATDRLYEAAGQPKHIEWFDSGHMLPQAAVMEGVGWALQRLKG